MIIVPILPHAEIRTIAKPRFTLQNKTILVFNNGKVISTFSPLEYKEKCHDIKIVDSFKIFII